MLRKGIYAVTQSSTEPDLVVLIKNNIVVGNKPIRISAIRGYLLGERVAQFTLNATIRIAKYVSKELNLNYQIPTGANGICPPLMGTSCQIIYKYVPSFC